MHSIAISIYFLIGLLGLIIGSFLNVVIYRLPLMLEASTQTRHTARFNLSLPRSHCPHCQHTLRVHENIPLLSFIALRGRCAHCHVKISWQYPIVEFISGALAVFIAFYFGFTWIALASSIFIFIVLPLTVIDIKHQILPDVLTLGLLWLGLLNAAILGTYATPTAAILGAITGYSVFYIFNTLFSWLTKKQGIGYGDFKLLAAFGAWFGVVEVGFIIFASAALGAIIGITLILFKKHHRDQPLPYGPFLVLAGVLCLFFQPYIHYLSVWLYGN